MFLTYPIYHGLLSCIFYYRLGGEDGPSSGWPDYWHLRMYRCMYLLLHGNKEDMPVQMSQLPGP